MEMPNPTEPTELSCQRMQRIGAVLGKRWTLEIIDTLSRSDLRFCDLRRALVAHGSQRSVSDRVLSERLKELETAGFVERVAGGYSLTLLGERLRPPLADLRSLADDMP